jgi:hypothetical protein
VVGDVREHDRTDLMPFGAACPLGAVLWGAPASGDALPTSRRVFHLHEVDMRLARLDGNTLRPREAAAGTQP